MLIRYVALFIGLLCLGETGTVNSAGCRSCPRREPGSKRERPQYYECDSARGSHSYYSCGNGACGYYIAK